MTKCQSFLSAKLRGDDAQAVLFIPEDMVGRIIGKGGVNIKKLTLRSGADAHMGDPVEGASSLLDRDDEFAENECTATFLLFWARFRANFAVPSPPMHPPPTPHATCTVPYLAPMLTEG